MTVQDELRKIADMLDQGECGFLSGGISISTEETGAISIASDLRVRPLGGMEEPTMFITEYLRLGSDGAELVRLPLSEWPTWAEPLRRMMTPNLNSTT